MEQSSYWSNQCVQFEGVARNVVCYKTKATYWFNMVHKLLKLYRGLRFRKTMKFNLVSIEPSGFQHAGAWYELAELIMHGFLRAGFDCSTSINRFAPNRLNIVFGVMHVTPDMERLLPNNTLLFNTEQLVSLSKDFNHQSYMNIRFLAQKGYGFIDYSAANISVLESWGATEVILMPLGFVPELHRLRNIKPMHDLLFYGGRNRRRIEY